MAEKKNTDASHVEMAAITTTPHVAADEHHTDRDMQVREDPR